MVLGVVVSISVVVVSAIVSTVVVTSKVAALVVSEVAVTSAISGAPQDVRRIIAESIINDLFSFSIFVPRYFDDEFSLF
jgi:hypothetical protein